ncbi:ribbon-helix-helix domain-containing protein, partial [Bacillus thuringiensis]
MVRVNTRISKKLNDWLDEYSKESGVPKSTLVHLALENYVNQKVMLEQMP